MPSSSAGRSCSSSAHRTSFSVAGPEPEGRVSSAAAPYSIWPPQVRPAPPPRAGKGYSHCRSLVTLQAARLLCYGRIGEAQLSQRLAVFGGRVFRERLLDPLPATWTREPT